jgi:predicted AlkP superfamily pyrophosphatase or phosphodiesterase
MPNRNPVVLIIIDGLCAAAPEAASCPSIAALRVRGASTLAATSLMPSITLPCHMSIFHSVPPTRHGITTNSYQPMARPLPGLLDVAHVAGLSTAAIHNWEPLRDLSRPLSLDFSLCRNDCETNPESDERIADEAIRCISGERPDLAFVYFGVLDAIGHRHGFMSAPYLAQLERTDAAIGRLLSALPAETTILLTTDHGGHDRAHGTDLPEDMIVPWLIAGPGIQRGHAITGPVSLLDTAPTLAHVLDLRPPREWEGLVVEEAFS